MKKLSKEEFIKKSCEVHGNKYNYSKVEYTGAFNKVCIICPEHGEFWQLPVIHMRGCGCNKCSHTLEKNSFIEKAKKIHGNKYDYSKVKYVNTDTKVRIVCPEHGEFLQTPHHHLRGSGCQKCSNAIKGKSFEKLDKTKIIETKKNLFIRAAKKKFGDIFDYSKINYINNTTEIKIGSKKYGEITITPKEHLRLKYGCREEKGKTRKLTTEQFIERSKKIHGSKYDYSKVEYDGMNKKVCIICPEHGEFWQTPNAHVNLREGCPICNESHLERDIKDLLECKKVKYKRQCTNTTFDWLNLQRLDFYLPDYNVVIECQGEQHYNDKSFFPYKGSDDLKKQILLDFTKKNNCEKNGLKMIYFVENKKKVLKEKIDEIYSKENTFDKLENLWESLKS